MSEEIPVLKSTIPKSAEQLFEEKVLVTLLIGFIYWYDEMFS